MRILGAVVAAIALWFMTTIAVAADAACSRPHEGKAGMRASFVSQLQAAAKLPDWAAREAQLEALSKRADYKLERPLVDIGLIEIYLATERSARAETLAMPLFENPYLARSQLDQIKVQLAMAASLRNDPARIVELLQPMIQAKCGPIPSPGRYLLASALLDQQREVEAMNTLGTAKPEPAAVVDWWQTTLVDLRCRHDSVHECAREIVRFAAHGEPSEQAVALLDAQLQRVIALPGAAERVANGRSRGLIDADGHLTPKYGDENGITAPKVTRFAGTYPPELQAKQMRGFVLVAFTIGADGRGRDARVIDSSPPGVFDRAALDAANNAVFEPRKINGKPVDSEGRTTISFGPGRIP